MGGRRLGLVAAASLAGLLLGGTAASAATKWDMPTGYPPTNFHTENVQKFADEVKAATNGELAITVHAGASLFKVPEIKRAVQSGQAQVGELLMSNLENESPVFGVDTVPFLAASYEASKKLWEASRPMVEKRLASQGMMLLYAVPWPPQGIYAKKDLAALADMKGLKFRAYNPATTRIAEIAGAVPVTIQAADLPQALATGVANSFISSGSTGYDAKVWESLTHFYDVQAWLPKNMVFANRAAFDKLGKPEQDALLKSAAAAEARGWQVSQEKQGWYLEQLAAKGMTVQAPGAAFKAELEKVGATMTEEWVAKAGPDGAAVIGAYRGM
jgi:TRAP-type C4-dicarboxylate transport system substrate-binding protein